MDREILVILVVAACLIGWLVNNWIRARHGYDLEDSWGGKSSRKGSDAETAKLREENARLHEKMDTMQDRMVVLEKIVTDRGYSLSDEIEALRDPSADRSDSGVPLDTGKTERV